MKALKPPKKLLRAARQAMTLAYSPYSKVKVGAAVLMSDGWIYSGCNVENASYGGTICAERTAVVKAISSGRSRKIAAVLVVTNQRTIWPPCGICRQFLSEFCSPSTPVFCLNSRAAAKVSTFGEILPAAFNKTHLASVK
jgi:cytidine deaminase